MPPRLPLDQSLPPAMLASGNGWWVRYRHYPVFSRRWWQGRCLRFGAVCAVWALMSALGVWFVSRNMQAGLQGALPLFVACISITCLGPTLATVVRHQAWPDFWERFALVLAILVGVAVSLAVNRWASWSIMEAFRSAHMAPPTRPSAAGTGSAALVGVFTLVNAVIYGMLGGGMALYAYLEEQRRWENSARDSELKTAHEQRQQAEWQLGLLQAQVEPHFLFNTFASIRALIRSEPDRAEHAIDTLVDYLRATIPRLREQDGSIVSNLGEQLDLCADYLELMHVRSGGRLGYRVNVDPALRSRRFPPLLLLTLVENAIKHGIEGRPGPGTVNLHAQRTDHGLRVRVADDGLGLRLGPGQGVGLHNLRKQLAARYAGHATFELRNREGGGAVAILDVPDEGEA
jgi:sensor histidine kinase YesM